MFSMRLHFKSAAHDACFPAGCLRFSKLLKLHQTEGKISSKETSIVCRRLYITIYNLQFKRMKQECKMKKGNEELDVLARL